ncbi:MAG TPA: stage 0 sporulation protein [Candidatus Omnitrophica bacterium]|nr:stage 0 sporulation protein [Candidatus Omnitrophota bacterium]
MSFLVNIRLREAGNVVLGYYQDMDIQAGDVVILEMDRGFDYGEVISEPQEIKSEDEKKEAFKIIRKATREDFMQINRNKRRAKGAIRICERKIKQHALDMKLIGAEYSFDRTKIIFYFTAEERIDFRALVRDLAKVFKTRIELRQIGVRDEAKLLGGYGVCGRPLCCATFLKMFNPVTIKYAKEQNLPMNPSKISGVCGRLMCCLSYEKYFYDEMSKALPKVGDTLQLEDGKAKVLEINYLTSQAKVEYEDGRIKKIVLTPKPSTKGLSLLRRKSE